uniref:Uncharacterized protein n=1 Tax=Vitis vinifera TaxID=29760 RepID=F6GXL8_VITVI
MMILWVIFELSTTIRGRDEPWPLASFGALTSKMKWRIDQGNGDAGRELEVEFRLVMFRPFVIPFFNLKDYQCRT